jgi:hypothetical protein
VTQPLVFLSHSSLDAEAVRAVGAALRERGIEIWIDAEQIAVGDSIPSRIEQGLRDADVLLVFISQSFLASSWCRAEYEPLLAEEIESGTTAVVPVRLDDAELPVLLSAKRYVDLRLDRSDTALDELAATIASGRFRGRLESLIPGDTSFEASALAMIVADVLQQFPVRALTDEQLLNGHSVVDLYRAVEKLIAAYQELFDEVLDVLSIASVAHEFYGAAYRVPLDRLDRANRKLGNFTADMTGIAAGLEAILDRDSALRSRAGEVASICLQISVLEDFLTLWLVDTVHGGSAPDNVKDPLYMSQLGREVVHDVAAVRELLEAYRRDLRSAVARARVT